MRQLSEIETLIGRPATEQELEAIIRPLLDRGVSPRGVAEALRATEKPPKPIPDQDLRTIRYEALGDGSVRRIYQDASEQDYNPEDA